jgi:hypothetical protein
MPDIAPAPPRLRHGPMGPCLSRGGAGAMPGIASLHYQRENTITNVEVCEKMKLSKVTRTICNFCGLFSCIGSGTHIWGTTYSKSVFQ